jgi:DHA2 family methylenomycin A resistance protein-like MFS transporter
VLLVGLVALAMAATLWRVPQAPTWLTPAFAVVALMAGVWLPRHVARTPRPVLQLSLLSEPGFLPAGLAVLFANFVMYTVFLAVPVFLSRLSGWGARDVGLLLAGMSILMAVTGPIGGTLSDRVGRRAPATFGSAVMIAGVAPLAFASAAWPWWALLLPQMVLGSGIGLSSAPVQTAAMQAAPVDLAGQAAGLFSTMRYAGSITGSAVMAAVLGDAAGVTSFHVLFAVLVGAALLATVAAGRLPGWFPGRPGPRTRDAV